MNEKTSERRSVSQTTGNTISPGEDKAGVIELIQKAYESLKDGETAPALSFLKEALEKDFEHQEVIYALKCLNWWLEKLKRLNDYPDPYERGGFILSQWKSYYDFLERIGEACFPRRDTLPNDGNWLQKEAADSCQYAIKHFVFSRALDYFLEVLGDGSNQQDPLLLLQTGRCCKGAGNWDEALKFLEQASRFRKEDSAILSELADVNALLGNTRAAKVLFREAFFLDPQGVDLSVMEAEMILTLRDKTRELGYPDSELAEWIPVWGCIWGIFSVKRELKPVELGRLKQSILSLENEFRSKSGGDPLVKPRLLNRYFWLVDYYEHNRDASGLLDETMLKIKVIDPMVYEQYRT